MFALFLIKIIVVGPLFCEIILDSHPKIMELVKLLKNRNCFDYLYVIYI